MPAGGRGQIEITLSTGSRIGILHKSVIVHTNDPERATVKLTVTVDVE
ncbi:MAG: hypothetical protein E4H40_03675 [Candidatus Brocadiia bacterium]|nr:MAG: hypothetical protein E4H40_03675 [Candidatus Brocadiia bacterium]